jgi:CheY-like chemotaxis protein
MFKPMKSLVETLRILIVDDLPDNLSLLKTLLKFEGYQVDIAYDGYTAIAKVEADPPDLILLDVMMPELDGYEVAHYFWQDSRLKQIPIWLVTGCYDLPQQHSENIKGILKKPIDLADLTNKISTLFNKKTSMTQSAIQHR